MPPSLSFPDPDDRQVLAAAIEAGADVIVTCNLTDFFPAALARFRIEAQHPDDFPEMIRVPLSGKAGVFRALPS